MTARVEPSDQASNARSAERQTSHIRRKANYGLLSLLAAPSALLVSGLWLSAGNPVINSAFSLLAVQQKGRIPGSELAFELVQALLSPLAALWLAVVLGVAGMVLGVLGVRARQRILSVAGLAANVVVLFVAAGYWYLMTHSD